MFDDNEQHRLAIALLSLAKLDPMDQKKIIKEIWLDALAESDDPMETEALTVGWNDPAYAIESARTLLS